MRRIAIGALYLQFAVTLCAATVRGRVFYHDMKPAPRVKVTIVATTGPFHGYAYSASDGAFYLYHVPTGAFRISAVAGNRVLTWTTVQVAAQQFVNARALIIP